ncbi:hypothetical protein EVA_06577, partial [gut metagenome]
LKFDIIRTFTYYISPHLSIPSAPLFAHFLQFYHSSEAYK